MRRGYADAPNGQIHYAEAGTGPAIVLLHQVASSAAMFERSAPLLAARYRTVAIDAPGFGLSDPPRTPGDLHEFSDAVIAVLDSLEIESAHVVGFHTGASVTLDLAVRSPNRVASATLVGILAVQNDEEREHWRETIVKPWKADGRGDFVAAQVEFLQLYIPDDGESFLSELISRLQAGPNYWWAYNAVLDHPAYDLFGQITQPVIVLNPADDPIYDETKRAHAALPGAAYAEMPGGADAPVTYPAEFAAAVLAFVDGLQD